MAWSCRKCGACCMLAGIFPQFRGGEGLRCRHLTAANLCAIYETRPAICRVPPDADPEAVEKACEAIRAALGVEVEG